jgi:hypothetical protein
MNSCAADSAAARWLGKKVLASRLLDDMTNPSNWIAFTTGAPEVADARTARKPGELDHAVAAMSFSRERSREGRRSLRMRLPARLDGPGPQNGRGWGSAGVRRIFAGEDWRSFNRLSLWIYPDCPGHCVVALGLCLHNDGAEKLPAVFGQEGETTVVLKDCEWNHVVWEIGNVARDKVTRLEISGLMSGHEPGAADVLTYDLDLLELQEVDPDHTEGWEVWPGRIAYSHAGYQPGAAKSAVAAGLQAGTFSLIDHSNGKTVLSKAVQPVKTPLGEFQLMDFSEIRQEGSYVLSAGGIRTHPFRIDTNAWRGTVMKALNFIQSERCGVPVPGIHGACHRDWTVVHGDKRTVINGGWHDAGDLTQGLSNTGEIVYALFSLAERLCARGEDPELGGRLTEEGRWGVKWILKTSFHDGYRNQGSVNSRWTDGIVGTSDDVTVAAGKNTLGSFTASAAEAVAARVLKESDPKLAEDCLKMAEEDWGFGREGMAAADPAAPRQLWRVTFDSDNVELDTVAAGVLASVDLWQATEKASYADSASQWARVILDSQERKRPDWDIPLLGYFYTGPAKDRILHYCHRGREQVTILALTRLCEAFPDHPDWMKWYSAAALYAEYLKAAAKYTEPYGVMPASIYRADEYESVPPERQEAFREQVSNGVPLGRGHYLRRFPVWMNYRGHFGTILPQAQALLAVAHLRRDPEAVTLAQHQAEWIIGRNPFAQSAMYGEGHDFPPLYAPLFGDVVGALPVGFQTRGDRDVPYWPVQSTWTYKEVWVHPVASWLWLMRDLAGPALVEGEADSPVEFIAAGSQPGEVNRVIPSGGHFRLMLAEGRYTVRCRGQEQAQVFMPTGKYRLDLRADRALGFEVAKVRSDPGEVRIRMSAQGAGVHRFSIRADNLLLDDAADREVVLAPGRAGAVEWRGRIHSPDTPWIVVVIADGNPAIRREVMGAAWEPQ